MWIRPDLRSVPREAFAQQGALPLCVSTQARRWGCEGRRSRPQEAARTTSSCLHKTMLLSITGARGASFCLRNWPLIEILECRKCNRLGFYTKPAGASWWCSLGSASQEH